MGGVISRPSRGGSSGFFSNADMFRSKGVESFNGRKYKKAIGYYNRAIRATLPTNKEELSSLYSNRGDSYRALKKDVLAFADFNYAIELNPANPYAYYNRAEMYKFQDKKELSDQDFERALLYGENDPDIQDACQEYLDEKLSAKDAANQITL